MKRSFLRHALTVLSVCSILAPSAALAQTAAQTQAPAAETTAGSSLNIDAELERGEN